MVMASTLTASLATALTVWQLEDVEVSSLSELATRRVAVVAGTTGASLAARHGGIPVELPSLEAAVREVEADRAEVVLFDLPALQHHLRHHPRGDLALVDTREAEQDYAFVFPPGSPLRRPVEQIMLELRERGVIERIKAGWLGQSIAKQ